MMPSPTLAFNVAQISPVSAARNATTHPGGRI